MRGGNRGVVNASMYVYLEEAIAVHGAGGRRLCVNGAWMEVRPIGMGSLKHKRSAQKAVDRLRSSLGRSGLKWSPQREQIVTTFLQQDHITIRDLYDLLNSNGRRAPLNTIYRTMRVLCDKGFAQARRFGDETHYDNVSAKGDHDHLICTHCGYIVEFEDPTIEGLQRHIAAANGFHLLARNHELYGMCAVCRTGRAAAATA